jgi:hypothetical protein
MTNINYITTNTIANFLPPFKQYFCSDSCYHCIFYSVYCKENVWNFPIGSSEKNFLNNYCGAYIRSGSTRFNEDNEAGYSYKQHYI